MEAWEAWSLTYMLTLDPPATGCWVTSFVHWSWVSFGAPACGEGMLGSIMLGVHFAFWVKRQRRARRAPLQGTPHRLFWSRLGTPESLYISSTVAGSPLVPVTAQFHYPVKGRSIGDSNLLEECPYSQHGDRGPHLFSNIHNTPGHGHPSESALAFQSIIKVLLVLWLFLWLYTVVANPYTWKVNWFLQIIQRPKQLCLVNEVSNQARLNDNILMFFSSCKMTLKAMTAGIPIWCQTVADQLESSFKGNTLMILLDSVSGSLAYKIGKSHHYFPHI